LPINGGLKPTGDGKQKLNQKSDNVLLPMLKSLVLPEQKLNQNKLLLPICSALWALHNGKQKLNQKIDNIIYHQ
jgi:hypothetical protein